MGTFLKLVGSLISKGTYTVIERERVCVCVCACACVRACVRAVRDQIVNALGLHYLLFMLAYFARGPNSNLLGLQRTNKYSWILNNSQGCTSSYHSYSTR